jgi:hypothetical protein
MIGGPNCNVPIGSVTDPGGIIVAGTLFGYDGGYLTASSIDATKAYWIKASSTGTITVSCSSSAGPLNKADNLTISSESVAEFVKIDITDAEQRGQRLYFNGKLDEKTNIESFSLPPLPPQGAFDVRLAGDYRLSESDEVIIEIQSTEYPIIVKVSDLDEKGTEGYVLKEIAGGKEIGSHRIVSGKDIVISNEGVRLLKIEKHQALPTEYSLEQNYPNPFNPSTTIKFSLPEAANVKLTIYNTLGEKISELIDNNLEAGRYSYRWDANSIASGIYIYKITAGKFVSVKKMILLK